MKTNFLSTICIFTIINSKVYYLARKNDKLIKLNINDEINRINKKFISNNELSGVILDQVITISKKVEDELIVNVLYSSIVNYDLINNLQDFKVVELDLLDEEYKEYYIEYLKNKLVLYDYIKRIYNINFVIPEIQKLYEGIYNIKIDRRNFRKRLLKMNIIESLIDYDITRIGRPAKLYKFKETSEVKNLL